MKRLGAAALAALLIATLTAPGQVTLSIGDTKSPPGPTSPHPLTLPNTLTLTVQAPSLKGATGVIAMDIGVTGSNPKIQIAPGLWLNLGPTFFLFDLYVVNATGGHTRVAPFPLTVPQAVGVFSAFWQAAVIDPAKPYSLALSNGVETPIAAGTPVWKQLAPATTPPGRSSAGALFDPVGQRMIVSHGSTGFSNGVLQDTWALATGGTPAWSNLNPTGTRPVARWGNSLLYDPILQRLLLHAGSLNGYQPGSDVHAISLKPSAPAAWSALSPSGTPPPGRRSHSVIFDPRANRMIVFGGGTGFSPGQSTLGDLWALEFASSAQGVWKQLTPGGAAPAAREMHTAVYDSWNHRMIVYGGVAQGGASLGDVWSLSLGAGKEAWTQLSPGGTAPAPRNSHTAVFDAPNQRMIAYGGIKGSGPTGEVLALGLAPGFERWDLLNPTGTPPAARESHLAVFDPVNRRMIMHAGFVRFPSTPFTDAWVLDLP